MSRRSKKVVMTINMVYELNYLVFASFLSLFLLEVGIAIISLISYYEYEHDVRRYIHSMWEINGTFAIFYLVELEVSYPSLMQIIGTIYLAPAFAAGLLVILRNAFIAYSEFIGHPNMEKQYIRIYSIVTIAIAFIVISILTSSISGMGVNLQASFLNMMQMLFNSFNILMFAGIVFITYFFTSAYFLEKDNFKTGTILGIVGVLLIALALYLSIPYIFQSAINNIYMIITLLLIMAVLIYLYGTNFHRTKYVAFAWIFIAIITFGLLQYPYYFNGAIDAINYVAIGPLAYFLVLITIFGGLFLCVGLGYFFYLNHKKEKHEAFNPLRGKNIKK